MKHLIGSAALSWLALGTQAQTPSAGTFLLGGSVGYSSTTSTIENPNNSPQFRTEKRTRSGFNVTPSAGYFITDKLALGLSIGFSSGKLTQPQPPPNPSPVMYTSTEKFRRYYAGPFVRYYHMVGEKVGLYGQLSAGYTRYRSRLDATVPGFVKSRATSRGIGAGITPGVVFFPTNKLGLELTLGGLNYFSQTLTYESDSPDSTRPKTKESGFNSTLGLSSLALGAFLYLGQ